MVFWDHKHLKNILQLFARLVHKHISTFFETSFTQFQCGFREAIKYYYNLEQYLIALTEKWNSVVDKDRSFGTLLTDLSKAFNCLPQKLLFTNLHTYGFSVSFLQFILSYLCNRKQGI